MRREACEKFQELRVLLVIASQIHLPASNLAVGTQAMRSDQMVNWLISL